MYVCLYVLRLMLVCNYASCLVYDVAIAGACLYASHMVYVYVYCMYVCVQMHVLHLMYVHMYMYVCMYACMYVRMYVCVYACMCVCMYRIWCMLHTCIVWCMYMHACLRLPLIHCTGIHSFFTHLLIAIVHSLILCMSFSSPPLSLSSVLICNTHCAISLSRHATLSKTCKPCILSPYVCTTSEYSAWMALRFHFICCSCTHSWLRVVSVFTLKHPPLCALLTLTFISTVTRSSVLTLRSLAQTSAWCPLQLCLLGWIERNQNCHAERTGSNSTKDCWHGGTYQQTPI